MASDGNDYTFCPETVETAEWDTNDPDASVGEIYVVLHACEHGEEHDGAHKCACGIEWDAEVPC